MFFSPLRLLNFEVLLKLLFPLQSDKRNYSILSSIVSMALFYTFKPLIHLEVNLWLNFIISTLLFILATYCTTYLPFDLIFHLYHILSIIYVCLGLFLNFMFCWPVCSFTYSILLTGEMTYGLYYLLKLIFPHCSFSEFSWLKFSLAFFESQFLLEISFCLVPEKTILLELHTIL